MEETTNKSGMSTGMIIGIAVIVAIVFGGGAYAYVNNKAEKEKKDLKAQITELQSQVSSATTATTVPSSATSATTATDATASWKTYTNSSSGFSLKYPSNYYYKESTNASGQTVEFSNYAIVDNSEPGSAKGDQFGIFVEIQATNASNDTTAGRIDSYKIGDYTVYNMATESGSTTLNGKITVINKTGNTFVVHSDKPSSDSALADWKSKFDTILSTLQFSK